MSAVPPRATLPSSIATLFAAVLAVMFAAVLALSLAASPAFAGSATASGAPPVLGIVITSDVFDPTPAGNLVHSRTRGGAACRVRFRSPT